MIVALFYSRNGGVLGKPQALLLGFSAPIVFRFSAS